jgi:hypothetical protein
MDVDLPMQTLKKIMSFRLKLYILGNLFPRSNLELAGSHFKPIICSFIGKGQRVDNNLKVSLTLIAPIIRQMANGSIIPPSTATAAFIPTIAVTDTNRKVRLALGNLQKIPNHTLRNNF